MTSLPFQILSLVAKGALLYFVTHFFLGKERAIRMPLGAIIAAIELYTRLYSEQGLAVLGLLILLAIAGHFIGVFIIKKI